MLAIVDIFIPSTVEKQLRERGFEVQKLPPHSSLPHPVASHPDMLLFFAPDTIFCTKSYQRIAAKELDRLSAYCQKPILTVEEETSDRYPHDILLNAAPIGKRLFCLPSHTARALTACSAYEVVPVRQGYAKCSTLPVGEDALITEDASIARAAETQGLEVLRVSSHAVGLAGYDTGFLGGASSFAPYGGCRQILFCGKLDSHPNASDIRKFCNDRGFETMSLSDIPLTDVGTMFLVQ